MTGQTTRHNSVRMDGRRTTMLRRMHPEEGEGAHLGVGKRDRVARLCAPALAAVVGRAE